MALKTGSSGSGSGFALGSEGEEGSIVAEINITPLTDIFLVLLIIFMVTSSVMTQMGVDVNLPKASSAVSESQAEGVIVTLLAGGRMRVNQRSIEAQDYGTFEVALKDALLQTKSRLVVLEGDQKTFLGSAIEIMDHARKAGAEKFAIATAPAERL